MKNGVTGNVTTSRPDPGTLWPMKGGPSNNLVDNADSDSLFKEDSLAGRYQAPVGYHSGIRPIANPESANR
jgi:hypothetical protein